MARTGKSKKAKKPKKEPILEEPAYEQVFRTIERKVEKRMNMLLEAPPHEILRREIPKKAPVEKFKVKKDAVERAEELRYYLNKAKKKGAGVLNRWGD